MIEQIRQMQSPLLSNVQTKEQSSTIKMEAIQKIEENDEDQVTYNKYGEAEKYEIKVGRSVYVEEFSKEDLLRWNKMLKNRGPMELIWNELVRKGNDGYSEGSAMSFFDFCYLVEKGDVVNSQNAFSSAAAQQQVQATDWLTVFNNTTANGQKINVSEAMKQLSSLQLSYELGLIKPNGGLMNLGDLQAIYNKQKYDEQRAFLEKQYAKDLETKNVEENRLEKAKQAYMDSI